MLCRGEYQVRPPLPFTPGVEMCGEVVALGPGVTGPASAPASISPAALPAGAFAEYAAVAAAGVLPAPEALDDAEAAALHVGYQTGWFGLHRRAALQPGETLLVHAAAGRGRQRRRPARQGGGGHGHRGRRRPRQGEDRPRTRGGHRGRPHSEDFVGVVKEATGGRGADVVYDPVGGDAYTGSTKCVAFEGRIVVVGFAGGTVPTPGLNHALVKNYAILGLHWGLYNTHDPAAVRRDPRRTTRLAAEGAIAPLVSARLPLTGAADAVQRVCDGSTVGRLTITP